MPYTLLLADDSATIQRVIELTFADEDVQVVSVSDGEAAIAAIDSAPPDIVLADVGMPGRSGYDVSAHVKRTPRLAHIPVVLITGAFEPIDQERAAAAGCDGVLAKPFEPQLVIGRVKELLAKPRPAAPPGPVPSPEVDRYFDELDQKFATLGSVPAHGNPQQAERSIAEDRPGSDVAAITPAVPAVPAEPMRAADAWTEAHAVGSRAEARGIPSLAEAFAALLGAEQSSADSGAPVVAPPVWPATPVAVAAPAAEPHVSDQLIEQIVRTVLERLSDRVVRDTTADIVSSVAERLVREEIERIKANIR